jgi:biotin transporter BioY
MSYPAAAAVAGGLARMRGARTFWITLAGAAAANVLILAAGACWLGLAKHMSAATVAHLAVAPFLGEDAVKVVLAALLATGWYRVRFDQTHTSEKS